ncbi:MAG: HPt (histidine-containing phosphotransfer) domain-containing protein [Gammaproteobacteria bacterium]|jgi:HPt (histidine-containing phosphotransfer) domain-containing protein
MAIENTDPANQLRLDLNVILRLQQDLGEDTSMVLGSYIESINEQIQNLATSGILTRRDDLHRWAHTLKSSCRCIGALKLAAMAAALEFAFEQGINIDIAADLPPIQAEYELLLTEISGH